MKIEKVNDRQIRCILTSEDLASRHLKINELAYGTEKAKDLFRDMMQQASFEFGFEAEDIPLMIEAIPISSESIVLIITKVEDPEELDTRFSKFAPSVSSDEEDAEDEDMGSDETEISLSSNIPEEVQDLFEQFRNSLTKYKEELEKEDASGTGADETAMKLYTFSSLSEIIKVAHIVKHYTDMNCVYRNPADNTYVLLLFKKKISKEDFARINHVIAEFGKLQRSVPASYDHIYEHYIPVLKKDAIDQLPKI